MEMDDETNSPIPLRRVTQNGNNAKESEKGTPTLYQEKEYNVSEQSPEFN